MSVFDPRICTLGEGALWHPERRALFWFDVAGRRLLSRCPETGETHDHALPEICSAAAWIDRDRLLIASETGLSVFDLEAGRFLLRLADLEADNPDTRTNDGRADPWGGFWIGTMGREAEPGAGAIYRLYGGDLRRLFDNISVPNGICFAPDGSCAYHADTDRGLMFRTALNRNGWPQAEPEPFVDFSRIGFWPDGAVTLSDGSLRVALWGEGAVIAVSPVGEVGARKTFDAPQTTCPAMGGEDYLTLFCTSAAQGLSPARIAEAPLSGAVFAVEETVPGRPEPAFRPGPA
ncbi:SMP-30/gluconolactonase/LRE family protein [Sinirhodobacter populi]|uniref:SMP-30/gluconolactonase/LRE family protein n=1 Tax=Paenirhodobacter populi TaxID=2306993 RepID=A0A443KNG5_9RHOB|nr:SMP-30/gluconolactonase/LRE family protein [Sinirhodobacter populi]RWR34436.1 SMP-30/gluconolactonase/LRE family protein [Sinirhodobacter populi]